MGSNARGKERWAGIPAGMLGASESVTGGIAALDHRHPCWDASGITVGVIRTLPLRPAHFRGWILSSASACRRAHGVRSTFSSSLNLAMVGACWNLLYWEDGNGGIRLR